MKLRCGFSRTAEGDVTSFSPPVPPSPLATLCTLPAGALRPIPMLAPGTGAPATGSVRSCDESCKEAGVAQTLREQP